MLNPRQRQLLDAVRQSVTISVEELAQQLDVTPQTVRRDIKQMEEASLLTRYHGGVGISSSVENIEYSQRQTLNSEAKSGIAAAVAQRVPSGCSLMINIGTTTEEVARALMHHQGLHVVTNNLNVAAILADNPQCEVIVAGGVVRGRDRGIVGEATIDFIRQFKVDIGIIGISSIDEDRSRRRSHPCECGLFAWNLTAACCVWTSHRIISPLYKSNTGERYNFSLATLNSVTSVTHF
ncbi:DeoR/GlpR transcriptional regulator [Undibacterium piscinae]|uniref:DeoR/GlpR transcriptional regulator n=1 Tax=Undibacterium piscinae TaxID=2495591 RepID=A0A6M4ABM8_9BURK|nr:DeoR/GlpR transcriptional regulator [Undibacterium piscinae]